MPTKGTRTRQQILEQAASLFNERGYHTTTLGDLMAATGLEKGGIYNHFSSKDELALAAYEHNVAVIADRLGASVREQTGAVERLVAYVEVFRRFAHEPPFPGGCPTLNTAVEAQASAPALHERAQQALRDLHGSVRRLVERGVERGELRTDVDPDATAVVVVAAIEGGLLLAQSLADPTHIDPVIDHLGQHLRSLAADDDGATT